VSSNEQAEAAVESLIDSLVAAWNVHDPGRFAAVFHEDADFTNVFGMHTQGRAAIERFHTPIFETMFRDSRLSAAGTRVRLIRPDVAAVDVRWQMTGARDPHGNPWPQRQGLISLVCTRENGEWAIAVMHNMDLPAEELAQAQADLQSANA
jgi:uncharacterized protein (TIGR02246 family)